MKKYFALMLLKEEECTQGKKCSTAQNATCIDDTMQHKKHNYTSIAVQYNLIWTLHYSAQHKLYIHICDHLHS